jgi:hypothetical protein
MDDIAPILRTPFVENRTLDAGSPGRLVDHVIQAGAGPKYSRILAATGGCTSRVGGT